MQLEQKQLEEYKEVNANMRHFSNMRIAVLTITLAVNGVLFQSTMQQEKTLLIIGLTLFGIISTLAFLIFENRVTHFYQFYHKRAIELEKILSLSQYTRPRKKPFLSATNATKFLYGTIAIFWLIIIIQKFI